MKLLNKTGIYYIIGAVIVFILGGFIFFYTVKDFVNKDISEKLVEEQNKVIEYARGVDSIPQIIFLEDYFIKKKVNSMEYQSSTNIKDTILIDESEDMEEVPARQITFYAKSKLNTYHITIVKSLVESDELIETILKAIFILICVFIISLYFINRIVSKVVWKPFYVNLKKIKEYDISDTKALLLLSTEIKEFTELNKAVLLMTNRIQKDYSSLKEFTQNASHEMQTPLAIMKNKLELIIQSDAIQEKQMGYYESLHDTVSRLSKLNQSLLLLTKIENNQFSEKKEINFTKTIKKHTTNFFELISAKSLTLKTQIQENVFLTINPSLSDILLSNLFTNAIKHNVEGGKISIELTPTHFIISNTGSPLQNKPIDLFERFKKDNSASESLGLGLSIVKEICENQSLKIDYNYNDPYHTIKLTF